MWFTKHNVARVHTLSTTSTHKSSQTVMDPSKYQSPYTACILGLDNSGTI